MLIPSGKKVNQISNKIGFIVIFIWSLAMVLSFWEVNKFARLSGSTANAPTYLSQNSLNILSENPSPDNLPTMLLFLHPNCPCSHATVCELARLSARNHSLVKVKVLFYQPADNLFEWDQSFLSQETQKIPGIKVTGISPGELQALDVSTSGQILLYSPNGQLIFSGGITTERGAQGDSAGFAAIDNYLQNGELTLAQTPVFGCPFPHTKANLNPIHSEISE